MRPRKVPMRKCVVCQNMYEKRQLIRVVKTPEGDIVIDQTGKRSGRGAYVCNSEHCAHNVQQNRALDRALKHKVSAEIYEQLAALHNE